MALIQVGKANLYTSALDVVAKTLTITGVLTFSLNQDDLDHVWDTTKSVMLYSQVAVGTINYEITNFTYTYVAGIPQYVWTFASLPATAVNGDTLVVVLNVPDQFLDYTALEKLAS